MHLSRWDIAGVVCGPMTLRDPYTRTLSVYGYPMENKGGRPPSSDPTVALTLRLPRSVLAAWELKAAEKGTSARKMIQAKLTEAVQK